MCSSLEHVVILRMVIIVRLMMIVIVVLVIISKTGIMVIIKMIISVAIRMPEVKAPESVSHPGESWAGSNMVRCLGSRDELTCPEPPRTSSKAR